MTVRHKIIMAAACCAAGLFGASALADETRWNSEGVGINKVTLYPKNWKGADRTWVDVVLTNRSDVPRRFRAVVKLGDEPPFAATTEDPVPPGEEASLTLSTTAMGIPESTSIVVRPLQ